jgi:hypothetical protein
VWSFLSIIRIRLICPSGTFMITTKVAVSSMLQPIVLANSAELFP